MMPAVPSKDGARQRAETASPPVPSKHDYSSGGGGGFSSRMANAFRRGGEHRSEREQRKRDREAAKSAASPTASSRTDVIDRLDLSGLGTSLFHHDSPYDACSPHSNRNARRAPVKAFDYSQDPMAGGSRAGDAGASGSGSTRPGLSPLAAATMRKMSDSAASVDDYAKDTKDGRMQSSTTLGSTGSRSGPQVPILGRTASAATSSLHPPSEGDGADGISLSEQSAVDRDVDVERQYQFSRGYMAQPSNVSRGRADVANPMADIWGVTSEPWQDFAAPASNKQTKALRKQAIGANNGAESSSDDLASAASSVFDMEAVMTGKPPQKLPRDDAKNTSSPLATNGDGNTPKRSKSLIKRIRSARQNPNVPPSDVDPLPPSPIDRDAQYFSNNNSSSNVNYAASSTDSAGGAGASPLGRSGGTVRYADQGRPLPRRARTHQHSPSMPMHTSSPPLQSAEAGFSYNGVARHASTRVGSNGNKGNGYLASPTSKDKDDYLRSGSTPRDRSVSAGAMSSNGSGSNGASNSSGGGGGLQRGNSIFSRLRGTSKARAQAAR